MSTVTGPIESVLLNTGADSVAALRSELDTGGRNATRKTTNSIKSRVVTSGSVVTLEVTARNTWPFTDTGRGPGKRPPTAAIREWVVAKGIEPDGTAADRAAFLIARAIGEKGTVKRPSFVDPVAAKIKTDLPGLLRRVLLATVPVLVTKK
jgi:hypothetical protein